MVRWDYLTIYAKVNLDVIRTNELEPAHPIWPYGVLDSRGYRGYLAYLAT